MRHLILAVSGTYLAAIRYKIRKTMEWTEDELKELPESGGFRLRGVATTRLETFIDAAFAFAMTMVVISINEIPSDYPELLTALKGIPAFAASFALIMLFWFGHRNWSRCYGLEDDLSIAISLGLIFVMLVYVYPLKLMFSALFGWVSGGWLPSQFGVGDGRQLVGLFAVYGAGYFAMAGALALLYRRARSAAESLRLDTYERIKTEEHLRSWTVQSITGLVSATFAGIAPVRIGVWAGFVYCTLPVTISWIARHHAEKAELARAQERRSRA